MRFVSAVLIILISTFASCDNQSNHFHSINGIWESLGSGWILQIKDSSDYAIHDVTSLSCLINHQGPLSDIFGALEIKDDTLTLRKGVIDYRFKRISQLPNLCNAVMDETTMEDPIFNFDVFAESVKEHYAFMELNNIDWDDLYIQQRSKISADTEELDLYKVIDETLAILKDNHAYLEASEELEELLEQHAELEENKNQDLPEYGDFQVAEMVVKNHLQEEMTTDSWLIQWGILKENIGYIQIRAMWLFADLEMSDSLVNELGHVGAYVETFYKMYEGDYINQERKGVNSIMDEVVDDLSDSRSIVIDIRFNGGGQDAVSFEILSRFISDRRQVATQKLKYGNTYTATQPLFINGTGNAYFNPLYVLTSQQTGSAAEAFSIATMAMPQVKRIGSRTAGAMSTALEKSLPNGWTFSISNEVYMDNDGSNYENIGVPVDYDLEYPKDRQTFFRSVVNDLEADKRNILEAIQILENSSASQ